MSRVFQLDATEIINQVKARYGEMKYGTDVFYKAPELYEISRQVKALAEVLVYEMNTIISELNEKADGAP